MDPNRIIFNILPQPRVTSTQGERAAFNIPEECPRECGLPRRNTKNPLVVVKSMKREFPDLWEALGGDDWTPRKKKKVIRYGCPHCLSHEALLKKRRLERYNKYKIDVRTLAKEIGFEMPVAGWSLYFYFPIPKSYKHFKKYKNMAGQLHCKKPDIDNLAKAVMDALSVTDQRVAQLSGLGKFWSNGDGYIEILLNQPIYNPYGVVFVDQDALEKETPRQYRVKKEKKRIKDSIR